MLNEITQIISTVGFPIAMCLVLLYEVEEMNKLHKEETNSLKDALNNNTVVLEKILTKLDLDEKEKRNE